MSGMMVSTIAGGLTVGAAICLYLATPHQRWRRSPWRAVPALTATVVALLAAGFVWSSVLHPATALCVLLSVFMTVLIALPYLTALLRGPSGRGRP